MFKPNLSSQELFDSVKRRAPGLSTNICVHKYFFETSPVWSQVREEEEQAKKELQQDPFGDGADDLDDDEQVDPSAVEFEPIDSRHLSSLPLIQSRVTKLLQNSPHGLHAATNLLISIVSELLFEGNDIIIAFNIIRPR